MYSFISNTSLDLHIIWNVINLFTPFNRQIYIFIAVFLFVSSDLCVFQGIGPFITSRDRQISVMPSPAAAQYQINTQILKLIPNIL